MFATTLLLALLQTQTVPIWRLEPDLTGKTRLWHVMDANGRFVAAVRGPREGRALHVAADEVWMAQAGEMEVPLMVRYRIRQ